MDIFEAEMARRFVVAVEKIANALDRKTEPTISKMEQVDDDAPSIDIVRCQECKHNHDGTCEYADTPQTEKASCETCRYYMMPWNGGECDGCCAGYDGKPSNYEPQTEREGE